MTKAQFIQKVSGSAGLSQKDTNAVIQAALETLSELLSKNDSISFVDFGSFSAIEKAARDVRIPTSGEIVQVPAKKVVKFKVGKALKEKISKS